MTTKPNLRVVRYPGKEAGRDEVISVVRGEIVSCLEEHLEELFVECRQVRATLDRMEALVRRDGLKVKLPRLKSGMWYRLAAQVTLLQEMVAICNHQAQLQPPTPQAND
jgi:hypothetical protein